MVIIMSSGKERKGRVLETRKGLRENEKPDVNEKKRKEKNKTEYFRSTKSTKPNQKRELLWKFLAILLGIKAAQAVWLRL